MSERFKVSSVGDGGPQTNYGSMESEEMDGKVTSSSPTSPGSGGGGGGGGSVGGGGGDGGIGGSRDSLASGGGNREPDNATPLGFGMANGN
ncbi:hypothetical protein Pmani_023358 [Petrolisthes manimaculis]|uniref:Uncharacterized protein n=1 Tax=Petrolisthes manimaculis TaxID=1843537 RepID=A0AAE1PCE8_9EUCA|nr:hypothetical protein Pmani_023358 [Petrolisthes manimaculis]